MHIPFLEKNMKKNLGWVLNKHAYSKSNLKCFQIFLEKRDPLRNKVYLVTLVIVTRNNRDYPHGSWSEVAPPVKLDTLPLPMGERDRVLSLQQ